MTGEKIAELDKLLNNYIGENKSIVDMKISRLTAPGENYGSILLKLGITLQNKKDDSIEELHVVAKLIPEEELFKQIFNIQVSCKVEIAFYDTIVPTLQQFQKERGVQKVIDFFPKMYAARINLNGYQNVNRFESFDLPTTEVVLKDLAAFHAVPLALKILEPETFQSKIQPYLKDLQPPPRSENKDDKKFTDCFELIFDILETDDEYKPLIPELRGKIDLRFTIHRKEPFITLGHGDFWINNTMVKFEDGRPVANKMVDFQIPRYLSPATDLFFFLWTSVRKDVLDEYLDHLIWFYHENFIKYLHEVNCNASPFTLDGLLEELKSVAKTQVMTVLFFTVFVVFSKRDASGTTKQPLDMEAEDVTEIAKERVIFFIKTCKRKGWL